MVRDLDEMIREADPDFDQRRAKRLVYEFGSGENRRKFYDRYQPGEAYQWWED